MINNNSFYKSSDLLNDDYKSRVNSFFNPYGYNLESNLKDQENNLLLGSQSKRHERVKLKKK